MRRLVKLNCSGRRVRPNFPGRDQLQIARSFTAGNTAINRVLEKGEPIYLAYHSSVLMNGINIPNSVYYNSGESSHASVITGRRFNPETNKCEYLIKNSYGTGCSLYARNLECENGQIWLPEELLEGCLQAGNLF